MSSCNTGGNRVGKKNCGEKRKCSNQDLILRRLISMPELV